MSEEDYVKEPLRDLGLPILKQPWGNYIAGFQPPGWMAEYTFRRLKIREGFNNELIDLIATGGRINIKNASKELRIQKETLEKQILKLKERGIISSVENDWELSEKYKTPSRTTV